MIAIPFHLSGSVSLILDTLLRTRRDPFLSIIEAFLSRSLFGFSFAYGRNAKPYEELKRKNLGERVD